jgi:hypothetical protein
VVFHICHSKVNMSGSLCFAHFCFLGGPSACVNFCKYWTKRMFTRCVNTNFCCCGISVCEAWIAA